MARSVFQIGVPPQQRLGESINKRVYITLRDQPLSGCVKGVLFGVSDWGLTVEQKDRTVIVPFRAILMVEILQENG